MQKLEIEICTCRAEMKDFKEMISERVKGLEARNLLCQTNPATCSTARKLDDYIQRESGKTARTAVVISCIVSCAGFALNSLIALFRRMK